MRETELTAVEQRAQAAPSFTELEGCDGVYGPAYTLEGQVANWDQPSLAISQFMAGEDMQAIGALLTHGADDLRALVADVRRLRADLDHARHSANARYAGAVLSNPTAPVHQRPLARTLWERSAPHCEQPASDGWEAGMLVK